MSINTKRKKIAVLGGGISSLSSIFELTNKPDWKEKYEDITVYQMGWRLGGKGASGRRLPYGRIEEHGLHVWMGFYNNSFDAIQIAYKELGRPIGTPLATWEDAFKQHSYIVLAQEFKNQWYPWVFDFPTNNLIPGQGDPLPTLWDFIKMTLEWMKNILRKTLKSTLTKVFNQDAHISAIQRIKTIIPDILWNGEEIGIELGEELLKVLINEAKKLEIDSNNHTSNDHQKLILLLEELSAWFKRELIHIAEHNLEILRLVILFDLGTTMISGLLKDGVLKHPEKLDSIDNLDLREWYLKHGALDITVESPLLKGIYDLVFAYHDGKSGIENADFAAGTAIRCIFRIVATYKGSVFWKMQAGMGDTVFTPLHKVLEKRGVKFKFFNKVKRLQVSDDGKSISTISMGRQAHVKNGDTAYDPYVDIQNLACWPSIPNYDQLVEGEKLKNNEINLESFYTEWKDEDYELKSGVDFDEVIFGISMGSIPFLCDDLIKSNSKWKDMVDNIKTVRTMALQLWLNKDLEELGWDAESPVMDAYVDPLNTWADMSQVIDKESWPLSDNVRNISYFCGPMEGGIPPVSESQTPEKALEVVKKAGNAYIENDASVWWPKVKNSKGGIDRSSIVDTYYRANIDPSERYVLSLKNTTQFRIHGGDSGFNNLYLAGDWTYNGINAGCIEACVMSGKIVSNAMVGYPKLKDIDGLGDI